VTRVARIVLLVAAGACHSAFAAGQPSAQQEPVPLQRFRDGPMGFSSYSGLIDSLRVVVRDSSAWRQLWQQINRPFIPPPSLPSIDFRREMVVVAALGSRPNGGFDVVIEGAAEDSSGIEIDVRRSSPAAGCPVSAVETQPVDLARLPASARSLRFRERSLVIPCVAP
jgi:protease stability complex PrcB-like protein